MKKNSVKCYQGMNFVELTLAQKTDIKNFRRATPDLVISPSSSSGIKICVRKFNGAVHAEHRQGSGSAETRALFDILIFFIWHNSHQWARASLFPRFLDHTQRRTTVGRTPLDEWSARRRDLYMTTHNIHDIHAHGGIRTHNLSRRVAVDLRLRPRGHWDRRHSH